MIQRVNPTLIRDIEKFGKGTWNECFHCGTCTAVCPLTEQGFLFPRKGYRAMQMGLQDTLKSSVEPWLCYYCGDCSTTCPRDANPGETMMILRRWLTSKYDWTGLAKKFYTSHWWEFIAVLLIGTFVGLLFSLFNPNPIFYGLNEDGGVMINKMFPVEWVHLGDLVMAAGIAFFLITNIARMWYFTILRDKTLKVPFSLYFTEVWRLVFHFGTQVRFNKCDNKKYWAGHWLLMTGYVLMFTMIVVFLPWFQTDLVYKWYQPQRLFGYYATFGLFFGLIYFFWGRIKKAAQTFKFSHISDWLFIIMLLLTTVTGILVHFFRIYGMPEATYWMYVLHLAVLVPMLVIEVPFSKWSHLAYRPFAVYFANVKKSAEKKSKV
jgi:ferredoxin